MTTKLTGILVVICATAGTFLAFPHVHSSSESNVQTNQDIDAVAPNEETDYLNDLARNWKHFPPSEHDGEKILSMPGTRFGFDELTDKPVLPLDWDDAPYPNEAHPNIQKFLDKRATDANEDKVRRYLREKPENVVSDPTIKDEKNNVDQTQGLRTDPLDPLLNRPIRSYVDHPGVQPRAHRSQHYQLRIKNDKNIPENESLLPSEQPYTSDASSIPKIRARDNLFVTYAKTASGMYPKVNPFTSPPGTNMLPTVYQNMRDRKNNIMPNTLPSHPNKPYNLHDGLPEVSRLKTLSSPGDDLQLVMDEVFEMLTDMPKRRLWEELDTLTPADFVNLARDHEAKIEKHRQQLVHLTQWALDIIEGNDGNASKVPASRAYRGFPLFNHSGHTDRNKRAIPIYGEHGKIIGANIDVHQIWYGGRIQSDTMFFDFGWDDVAINVETKQGVEKRWYSTYDPNWDWCLVKYVHEYHELSDKKNTPLPVLKDESMVLDLDQRPEPIPADVPWTVTYTIDVLNRGEDDFSPTQIYFDDIERINFADAKMRRKFPAYKVFDEATGRNELVRMGPPHIAMDQTFFPMQEGTRTKLKIKMAPPKYSNVTYTWGWRNHPPRAQAVENSHKRIPPMPDEMLVSVNETTGEALNDPTKPAADHFLRRHKDFPGLPPFGRLRISDHERFTFEGINFDDENLFGVPSLDDEVMRYLPERAPWLRNQLQKQDATFEELRAELKGVFGKLENAPFFHPLPTKPEHGIENLVHLAELGKDNGRTEDQRKVINKQFWALLDELYVEQKLKEVSLWLEAGDDQRENAISDELIAKLHDGPCAQRIKENYKLMGPISRIGDLAPAKRMWRAFREMNNVFKYNQEGELYQCVNQLVDAQAAFRDWEDRNHLPSGLRPDSKSDFSIVYLNNTIYGESIHGGLQFDEWELRSSNPDEDGAKQHSDLKLTVYNGDYFLHGYINPDFGGNRGWENQFKPTLALGGAGSFFTFGRFNWRFNSEPGAIGIPPAVRTDVDGNDMVHPFTPERLKEIAVGLPKSEPALSRHGEPIYDGTRSPGVKPFPHRVWIRFNFEPSRRLRFYQFDPLHHDAAIFSIH